MARDAAATRERILVAAIEEFAAKGLAGARVDRIAEAASANKRSLYVYFGDKEGLFSAALSAVIERTSAATPITVDDLPGYAGRIFDYMQEHPEALRMSLWRQLERPDTDTNERATLAKKVTALSKSHFGSDTQIRPVDLIAFVNSIASALAISPHALLRADGSDPTEPARLAAHRSAVVEAVRRLCS